MKHAITGPLGRIRRVSDEAVVLGGVTLSVPITNAQATQVAAGADPLGYHIVEGRFMSGAARQAAEIALRKAQRQEAMASQREAAEAARRATLSPEALAAEQAHDAAAAVFEAMELGKQALWETTRAKVSAFIRAGDFTKAYQTIATVPSLYPGMEDDRAAFLALFPS